MTRLLAADPDGIAEAAALLRDGTLVAFGTETVYGLGGRADRPGTVAAIYQAKGRPAHNPLICHYADRETLRMDVEWPAAAELLAVSFWPGPLTLVLPRRPGGRIAANAGPPDTLAVRIPAPAASRALLAAVGVPVAAPSANRSGRISPTRAADVLEELGGAIGAVLDCGPCAVGLESTVIDLSQERPLLLRPGAIAAEAIAARIGRLDPAEAGVLRGPGQLASHYAPRAALRLEAQDCGPDEALLAFGEPVGRPGALFQLSATRDLDEAAARLYAGLRTLDETVAARGLRGIAAMALPAEGLGAAIRDRLARAATPR